jgi:cell division septal protein FtsQ
MRNRLIAFLALATALAAAFVFPRVSAAVVEMEFFRVEAFELDGARYLTVEEALAAARVPEGAGVWDDPTAWVTGLEAHPLVRSARVRRRLPATLVFEITEREPVALIPTPILEAVDADGNVLPVDPSRHGLDLPLLGVTGASRPAPEAVAVMAAEVERLGRIDPAFLARTSELVQDERGDLIARWSEPQVAFRFRPEVPAWRLREGQAVLAEASLRAVGSRAPATVDLRFADQVVIGRRP